MGENAGERKQESKMEGSAGDTGEDWANPGEGAWERERCLKKSGKGVCDFYDVSPS